jgi:hypothetical protein
MSFQKAVNEIASLLTQGGTPANHSQDVAARLSYALEEYYNYRQSLGNSQKVTDSSSKSAAFRNAFRSPEELPTGAQDGAAGADGRWAWAAGKDGKDGTDGTGSDGSGNGGGIGGGGGGITINLPPVGNVTQCSILKGLLKSCGICAEPCKSTGSTSAGKCSSGSLSGLDVCSILERQAKEIGKLRKELTELKDAVKAIEKQLKDTVNCP